MNLLKWSKRPAAGVEARKPEVNIIRGLVARATTPLLPDDYLHLINPLWSARELRGKVLDVVVAGTADSSSRQTPPAMMIGVVSGMPPSRIVSRSAFTRG